MASLLKGKKAKVEYEDEDIPDILSKSLTRNVLQQEKNKQAQAVAKPLFTKNINTANSEINNQPVNQIPVPPTPIIPVTPTDTTNMSGTIDTPIIPTAPLTSPVTPVKAEKVLQYELNTDGISNASQVTPTSQAQVVVNIDSLIQPLVKKAQEEQEKANQKRQIEEDNEKIMKIIKENGGIRTEKSNIKSKGNALASMVLVVVIALAIVFILRTFVVSITRVSGASMMPSYESGDILLEDLFSYKITDPQYNDVITAKVELNGVETKIIKRVVALPGDTVYIRDGYLYVNDKQQETKFETMKDSGIAAEPIILKDNEYFLLGDNRNNSLDSRFAAVGVIDRSQIIAKVKNELPQFLAVIANLNPLSAKANTK